MFLLRHQATSGEILGVYESTDQALLEAQQTEGEPGIAFTLSTVEATAREVTRYWYVLEGAAVPKTAVTLTGTPAPFAADAVTTCTVTVDPFVPCTLVLDGVDVVLTDVDPTLVLTSDVPRPFLITLRAPVAYWAVPLLVEAV